jgi:hypothetical protein
MASRPPSRERIAIRGRGDRWDISGTVRPGSLG